MKKIFLLMSVMPFMGLGCASGPKPNLQKIYNQAAMHSELERNPVILIPGLLGSRLADKESGEVVWGIFGGKRVNPEKENGARLLALPMEKGKALKDLKDSVEPVGVLDRAKVKLFGLSLQAKTYANIISVLGSGGYLDEELISTGGVDYGKDHFTCFQFPYDFRRDVVEVAAQFDAFLKEKKAYVEREIEKRFGVKKEVKFDIVTHSHGGNVARYFLRYGNADLPEDGTLPPLTWAGAEHVERVVMVGPPNAGAVKAFRELVLGRKIATGLPKISPAVAGTKPAIYQLLPRSRHGAIVDAADPSKPLKDIFDPKLWEKLNWGLANPTQAKALGWLLPNVSDPEERRSIALDHQKKCLIRAKNFMRALDRPSENKPDHLKFTLIAGDAEPTESKAAVDLETGEITVIERAPGDVTVTRASALMDERQGAQWQPRLQSPIQWDRVIFIFNDHVGLTKDPAFADNLLYELLESQRF